MNSLFTESMMSRMHRAGLVAVLVIDRAEDAVPLAHALLAGGIDAMELTLRTPAAIDALKRIRAEVPEMMAGIGTILTVDQVKQVKDAGAAFGVAPGMNPRVVKAALDARLPFAPGIATPSDIEAALEFGCRLLKFFPAEASGGLGFLKNIAAPYAHLNLKYMPLGGMDVSKIEPYLKDPNVFALGGSWIAPREVIKKQDWATIRDTAQQARAAVDKVRSAGGAK